MSHIDLHQIQENDGKGKHEEQYYVLRRLIYEYQFLISIYKSGEPSLYNWF